VSTEESNERFGYCDLHLEWTLTPAGSWIAGQYGGDNADCNPFRYWRCSRPDCSRCYAPDMHGYFDLDQQQRGSIQTNPQRQEKCGRHAETPFMVIGKFGRGRRFRCPYHGCDYVGPMVAEDVADADDPEEPQLSTRGLTRVAEKEAFELSVFNEFAKAAHLPVNSPENSKPPRPDIRCLIDGDEHWFELGRITDTKLAKTISVEWPKDPKPFSFAQKEPFVRIIKKKAKAQYQTDGRPLDLVLHFDQQPPDRAALDRHLQEHAAALNDLKQRGPFSRIWIYDGWSKSVLWKSAD
jgi:hypothetical protein